MLLRLRLQTIFPCAIGLSRSDEALFPSLIESPPRVLDIELRTTMGIEGASRYKTGLLDWLVDEPSEARDRCDPRLAAISTLGAAALSFLRPKERLPSRKMDELLKAVGCDFVKVTSFDMVILGSSVPWLLVEGDEAVWLWSLLILVDF